MRISIIFISLLVSIQSFGQTQSTLPAGAKQQPSYRSPDGRLWIGVPGGFFPFYTSAKVDSIINSIPVKNLTAGENIILNKTDPDNWIISSTGGGSGSSNWGDISGTLSSQTDLWTELSSRMLVGGNISLLNNNTGYIVSGTEPLQVRNNSDLDSRYLQTESDPTIPEHVKNISSSDILSWTNKLNNITASTGITIDKSDPLNPIISASAAGTDLSIGNITGGGVEILSSTGSSATIPVSNGTQPGLINAFTYNRINTLPAGSLLGRSGPGTGPSQIIQIAGGLGFDEYGRLYATGAAASVFTRSESGLVPAPGGSTTTRYLREDGAWVVPSSGGSSFRLRSGANAYLSGDVTLIAGANTTLTQSGSNITISSTGGGGGSFQLRSGTNSYLTGQTTLLAGAGIQLTQSGSNITITNTGGGGGGGISALTGDVLASGSGSVPATISNGAVTNAKLANMSANTIKGRLASSGAPQDLTIQQLRQAISNTTAVSGTTLNIGASSKFYRNASSNINFTLSNFAQGLDAQVEIKNTSSGPITVSFTGVSYPSDASQTLPAGKTGLYSLTNISGTPRLTFVIYD